MQGVQPKHNGKYNGGVFYVFLSLLEVKDYLTFLSESFLYLSSVSPVLADTYPSVQCISPSCRPQWFVWAKQQRCLNK